MTDVTSLDPNQLDDIARGLAAGLRPDSTPFETDTRCWFRLLSTETYDAWLIHWPVGGSVQPHDHGGASGSFAVVRGSLVEIVFDEQGERRTVLDAGHLQQLRVATVHDVINEGPGPATSVHVYSPPLASMAFYDSDLQVVRTSPVEHETPLWQTPAMATSS